MDMQANTDTPPHTYALTDPFLLLLCPQSTRMEEEEAASVSAFFVCIRHVVLHASCHCITLCIHTQTHLCADAEKPEAIC